MPETPYEPLRQQGPIAFVDMKATTTAHRGDYLVWSAGTPIVGVIEADSALTAYGLTSAIGVTLADHPQWTPLGSAFYNTALPVLVGAGVIRASSVGNLSAGYFAVPFIPGSGRVGQTGATGRGPVYTAVITPVQMSAVKTTITVSATAVATAVGTTWFSAYSALPLSAVGRIVKVISAGNTGQIEIELFPPHALAAMVGVPKVL